MAANVPKNETPAASAEQSTQPTSLDEAKHKAVLAQLAGTKTQSEEPPTATASSESPEAGFFQGLRK